MTRDGLIQPKPIMTRVSNPPRKKIPKKIFRGPTFFSRKKFLLVWGVSVIMGFLFKTKPVSSWVLVNRSPSRVIKGFPQTPRVTPETPRSLRNPLHTTLDPPLHPPCTGSASGWTSGCPEETSGLPSPHDDGTGFRLKTPIRNLGGSRGDTDRLDWGSMTRGGDGGYRWEVEWGRGGIRSGDMTRRV